MKFQCIVLSPQAWGSMVEVHVRTKPLIRWNSSTAEERWWEIHGSLLLLTCYWAPHWAVNISGLFHWLLQHPVDQITFLSISKFSQGDNLVSHIVYRGGSDSPILTFSPKLLMWMQGLWTDIRVLPQLCITLLMGGRTPQYKATIIGSRVVLLD